MLKVMAVGHDATGDYAAALKLPMLTAGGFGGAAAALHPARAGLFGIEMVLARFARYELPRTGNFQTFGK